MVVLKEITVWDVDYRQPNHTYLVDGDRIVAYKPWHGSEIKPISLKLNRGGRKFVSADYVPGDWAGVSVAASNTVQVAGSKGNTYTVTLGEKPSCECTGFKFHGDCKHIKTAMAQ